LEKQLQNRGLAKTTPNRTSKEANTDFQSKKTVTYIGSNRVKQQLEANNLTMQN